MIALIVIAVIVVILVIYVIATYNGLISLRNRTEEAFSDIDTQLKRRHDLIPNLVETVKGYASHERGTLDAVTQARAAAAGATSVNDKVAAENMLTGALGRADAGFVKERTGFSIGGVAPLAHANPTVTLIDRELFRFAEIWAAAGHPNGVFMLTPAELVALTAAPVADVVVDVPAAP